MTGTLLLTKEEVRGLLHMPDVIVAVEDAYRAYSGGDVDQPPYMGIHLSTEAAEIDFKAGYHRSGELVSLKASSGGFRDNPGRFGLPNGMGTVLLFNGTSGALSCVMDGSLLTGFRTGASGAVSVRALARPGARRLAAIGTGNQARMQIRAIREVMRIEAIDAWGRSPEGARAFAAEIEAEFGIPVTVAETAQKAVAEADVVVATTRASGVVLRAGWLRPGTHLVAIGADQPGKQELDPELFRNARVLVDAAAQCCEKGEVQHALRAGVVSGPLDEIGKVLLGRKPGRETDDQITIFDSTGMAIQDNTTAAALLRQAKARGIGTYFDFLAPAG
ncbi:ornithine cyclodeaminase family protein [Ponticoccus alexandrii]|uniref:Ornithine cyclodeaminase family protein n=1 Tax=Ponticoccus alexandrii TaxID=1943633 RepID=A0ABX7FG19_9RHOB|nr:ornithine cyclodeaminase family protein [Ponticoccus alexandrii]ETA49375.1 ornithine cyclodeaminase [Rhodobacteraceae bacterium PD-2]QRF69298.1 ornithine cyclodeaminase family protein [Ponticoccus alexandrii]